MLDKIVFIMSLLGSPKQVGCIAEAIYFEARSQPIAGQMAIGEVIVTRAYYLEKDPCWVVHHDCQFSYYCDGKSERMVDKTAKKKATYAANMAIVNGPGKAWYFNTLNINSPYKYLYTIEDHKFYER